MFFSSYMCYLSYVKFGFIVTQGVDENIEKEEENVIEEVKDEEVPPIPPLPQSHLQRTHTTADKNSAVAKIISQFQEASNISNVNQIFYI